jgi:hypothetical protein
LALKKLAWAIEGFTIGKRRVASRNLWLAGLSATWGLPPPQAENRRKINNHEIKESIKQRAG